MEIKTFTSTLALCVLLTSTALHAGKEGGEEDQKQKGTSVKPRVLKVNDQIRVGSVNLTLTDKPDKVEEEGGNVRVTTDNNALATYQLISPRRSVIVGEKIKVPYEIVVEEGGKVSLGLLNTARNRWYGLEGLLFNTETAPKTFKGVYERVVPEGETETSLVFRNYHLGAAGQSIFTILALGFETSITPILANEFVAFENIALGNTGKPERVEEKDRGVTVVTDNNASASYQLRSDLVPVNPGDSLEVTYKVTLQPHSKISFGFLNTQGNGWYPSLGKSAELILTTGEEEQTYEGTYLRTVPVGEEKTSLVVRNYHLRTAGQSTFAIEKLGFKKQAPIITETTEEDSNPLMQSLIELPEETKILQSVDKDQTELTLEQQEALTTVIEKAGMEKKSTPWTVSDYLTFGLSRWFK